MTISEKNQKDRNKREMKRVRADVKAFVEKGITNGLSHLGEYPDNMDDAVRTIIALQDLLDKSMERHAKATQNYEELQNYLKILCEASNNVIKGTSEELDQAAEATQQALSERDHLMKAYEALEEDTHRIMQQRNQAQFENNQQTDLINALKLSLREALKES